MFNNDLLSDVSLVVRASIDKGDSKESKMAIPAHKMVLSICSRGFFAMFCGDMAERPDSIDLLDCEYEGELEMLRYMYSEKAELNESNVTHVLYVANPLMNALSFCKKNLNTGNVFFRSLACSAI